jgi:hypothetical protein
MHNFEVLSSSLTFCQGIKCLDTIYVFFHLYEFMLLFCLGS